MRVIRTADSDQEHWIPRLCTHDGQPYAILSHRWLSHADHEVLFADIEEVDRVSDMLTSSTTETVVRNSQYAGVTPSTKPGFGKLQGAARQALKQGYQYVWVDTCCIDKSSSAELSEAINSMWKWYASSAECYVYLADVPDTMGPEQRDVFAASEWWTRGWTLQELLAPQELTFFSATWTSIGQKRYMDITISDITGIDPNIINGTMTLDSVCVAQRMSWSSARVTSRIEDQAYALMGLFSVNMPMLYGEGERAFLRLQQEIMKDSDDESIFAWRDNVPDETYSGLLANRPSAFASCRRTVRYQDAGDRDSYSMTNKGLSIALLIEGKHTSKAWRDTLMGKVNSQRLFRATLHCADPATDHTHVGIYLYKTSDTSQQYARVCCSSWAKPDLQGAVLQKIFVKQSHDQQPAYDTLRPASGSIRLLRIVPTEDPMDVKVRLTKADMESSRYTAVSYVWTATGEDRSITVNSDTFTVNMTAFEFLQKARRERRTELFWIDAICIKMRDNAERSSQLPMLMRIFGHATRVIAWLGDFTAESSHPLPLTAKGVLARSHAHASVSKPDDSLLGLQQLEEIAAHTYWTLMWTAQDLLAAHVIEIETGARCFTVRELLDKYHHAVSQTKPFILRHTADASRPAFMTRVLEACLTRERNSTSDDGSVLNLKPKPTHRPAKFETLLTSFQHHTAAVRLEKVYGLVQVSDIAGRLSIDYSKSRLEVFFDVVDCLKNDLTLSILPVLSRVLDVDLNWYKAGGYRLTRLRLAGIGKAEYAFCKAATPVKGGLALRQADRRGGHLMHMGALDQHIDTCDYLAVEFDASSEVGLAFTPTRSREKATLPSEQQPAYELSDLCFRAVSGHYKPMDLGPTAKERLARTTAVLENSEEYPPLLRIKTDRLGLLALGFYLGTDHSAAPETAVKPSDAKTKAKNDPRKAGFEMSLVKYLKYESATG